ncbi:MAG: 16S rRNA (uracil(1498)-N(3))-methyltransferase [Caldilineaceae bacterium]|nr:16S rRNA (uracil(1498)-N(3))-methyltransferase [Caldilineaceae bacterium]
MHRFFLTHTPILPGQPVDLSPLAHQLRTVLRLSPGETILLLDNASFAYPTEISRLDKNAAAGNVLSRETAGGEPPVALSLYLCALKADKFEWVLQKGVEIGVSRFVPVISSRTIVRPAEKITRKYTRWQTIIREAAEQCGRGRLPLLADPLDWGAAVAEPSGLRLLPWEETNTTSLTLGAALAGANSPAECSLLIGPEGGIDSPEAAQAIAAGWLAVTLGPRILRAETAAITAAGLILHRLGDLG